MGFFIFSNNGKINYGIKNYVADTEKDLEQISTRYPGSMVYVIETQKFYMANQNGTWVETKGGNDSSEIDEDQVNALIDAKINEVPTLPDPTGSNNQVLMTQNGTWKVSTIPEGQTVIIDETLSTADNDHVPSTKLVTNTVNSINNAITAINNAGYQTAANVQSLIQEELSDITSFEYYLCKIGEYSLETGIPIAEDLDEAPDTQHIYLTPGENDNLNMYAYINNEFVFLGTTEVDLENYYTTTEVNNLLMQKANVADLETLENNIPTNLSDLNNDEDFITLTDVNNAGYLTSVNWQDIQDKPTNYTPNVHTHAYSDITNPPSHLPCTGTNLQNQIIGYTIKVSDSEPTNEADNVITIVV